MTTTAMAPSDATRQVARVVKADNTQLWPEPLESPGYVPRHLKRAVTTQFPLLEVIQRLLYRLQPGGSLGDLEKILALIGLYQAARPVYHYLRDLCTWAFTVQITIPENDAVANEVLAWMGAEVILKSRTRSAMLVTGGFQDANDDFHRQLMMHGRRTIGAERVKDEVLCLPPIGTRLFWVGFRPFIFSRRGGHSYRNNNVMSGNLVDDNGHLQNSISLMTLGWSLQPLRDFTTMCHDFKMRNLTGTTTVYFAGSGRADPYGNGWQSVSKAIRKLDTIDMDEDVKADIIRDAEYYYSDQSCLFFADCGIPYRRGYLFHGPPGTGKSSFSAAMAGHLGCDIYHINLATGDISDGGLHRLFLGLPRKCIVVIEDIDSAGIGREQGPSAKPPSSMNPSMPPNLQGTLDMNGPFPLEPAQNRGSRRRNMVTLSGLLNAIDGNASQEGRLLIMTSNNPDALDPALVRPGRIDKKVYFGNMSRMAGKSIFKRLIGRSAVAHDAVYTMAQIEQYATEFTDKVPANEFTPAEIQNFLQGCRGDPVKALRDIDAWMEDARTGETADATSAARASETSAILVPRSPSVDPMRVPLDDDGELDSVLAESLDSKVTN